LFYFSLAGLSGVVVNMAALWFLVQTLHFPYLLASPFAIQTAILNNFIWNDRFTWRDRVQGSGLPSWWHRLLKFSLVSWIAGGVNWLLLATFVELLGIHYLVSNLLAIVLAAAINYFLNDRWTFRPSS